eukprot:TRINITY_DN69344_c0_g1_i1.p1 TRINITY_DN69344_c0_g1~~TRINITY_DN69344_c0_g1_i1.p1  ORF type:complete len:248 (-),score=49.69 TRINITY_DN69344_c0_g1_i1:90-797(-)
MATKLPRSVSQVAASCQLLRRWSLQSRSRSLWILMSLLALRSFLSQSQAGFSTVPTALRQRQKALEGHRSQSLQALRLAATDVKAEASSSIFEKLFAADSRPVVLYDGVCNMCNKAVDTALEKDPDGRRLRFTALQSEVGQALLVYCGRAAEDISSMVVVKPDGTCLVQSDAPLFVGQQLEGSALLRGASEVAQRLLPKFVRDAAYDKVAENRYRVLGKRDEMRLTEEGLEERFV